MTCRSDAAQPAAEGRREGMSYGRGAALLSALIGVTGLLTYAFHSLAAHALGRDAYGAIGVLWAAVFLTASVIYRPVEQLLSRTIAEREARDRSIGVGAARRGDDPARARGRSSSAIALPLQARRSRTSSSRAARPSTGAWSRRSLFYAASYFARGFLAGQRRFGALRRARADGVGLARRVRACCSRSACSTAQNAAGVAIAAAPLLSLIVVPWALGGQVRADVRGAPAALRRRREPEFTLSHGLGFAGAVLVIMVSEQAILNSGVLIVKADTGSDALAALIFAVLMIARAPLQLFQAVSTTLLPHLTRLIVTEQDDAHGGDFGRSVRLTVLACLAFGARDRRRRAARRTGRDAAAVRPGLRLRPRRARAGRRRHGPLPRRDDPQPGRARPGPRARRVGVVGGLGHLLRRVPADRRHGAGARGRGRVPRDRGAAVVPALPRLPPPGRVRRAAASGPARPRSSRRVLAAADEGT